jgi:hypothetical protein
MQMPADVPRTDKEQPSRSYRCHYTPLDRNGLPVLSDPGLLPFVQLKATNAEHAHRVAFAAVGCPISYVERLEEAAEGARS